MSAKHKESGIHLLPNQRLWKEHSAADGKNHLKDEIDNHFSALTPREKRIVRMYYGLCADRKYTLEEIGDELNISSDRARKIKRAALEKLGASVSDKLNARIR